MPASETDRLADRLLRFAWGQWAQLGLRSTEVGRRDDWAIDPEALILLSLELGRDDPRLFDEVLDWLAVNQDLISARRVRSLCVDEEDRRLASATLAWLAGLRGRASAGRSSAGVAPKGGSRPLFRTASIKVSRPDPAFEAQGLLRTRVDPRRHSGRPDVSAPVAFAFRLRRILGVGVRAEVIRVMLGAGEREWALRDLADSTGYAKRNVQEAAGAFAEAGVLEWAPYGNERRFRIGAERWRPLLGLTRPEDPFPTWVDWPVLFGALRRISRGLREIEEEELDGYPRQSASLRILDEVTPDLARLGVAPAGAAHADVVEAEAALSRSIESTLDRLEPAGVAL